MTTCWTQLSFPISEKFQDKFEDFCFVTICPKTQWLKQTDISHDSVDHAGSVDFCCPHSCSGVGWSRMSSLTWPVVDMVSVGDDLALFPILGLIYVVVSES